MVRNLLYNPFGKRSRDMQIFLFQTLFHDLSFPRTGGNQFIKLAPCLICRLRGKTLTLYTS